MRGAAGGTDWAESWVLARHATKTREALVTWDSAKLFILERLPRLGTGEVISGI